MGRCIGVLRVADATAPQSSEAPEALRVHKSCARATLPLPQPARVLQQNSQHLLSSKPRLPHRFLLVPRSPFLWARHAGPARITDEGLERIARLYAIKNDVRGRSPDCACAERPVVHQSYL